NDANWCKHVCSNLSRGLSCPSIKSLLLTALSLFHNQTRATSPRNTHKTHTHTMANQSSSSSSSKVPSYMKYAKPWPSQVTSEESPEFEAWTKKFRSSDDSIYKSRAVGRWSAKRDALRESGYVAKHALLGWNNSHDARYQTDRAYRAQKDAADAAELGDMYRDWLFFVDWDEEAEKIKWLRQKSYDTAWEEEREAKAEIDRLFEESE
ncbi:hypothetical protein N431DRAFT_527520, partial [Stipitochalara longipes BDJ]